jgi:hypothetical protein
MSGSAHLMRLLFTWLVAFGVLVGLQERVFATDPCGMLLAMHAEEHSGHHHDTESPCDPAHDKNCPVEHHQHCACVHSMPIAENHSEFARLGCSAFSMAPIRSEADVPPDGPFTELDKPPLI